MMRVTFTRVSFSSTAVSAHVFITDIISLFVSRFRIRRQSCACRFISDHARNAAAIDALSIRLMII